MHVSVGGEGLAADGAFVGSLSAVHQHVTVQRTGGTQRFPTDAAGVVVPVFLRVMLKEKWEKAGRSDGLPCQRGAGLGWEGGGVILGFSYLAYMHGELVQGQTVLVAQRADEAGTIFQFL